MVLIGGITRLTDSGLSMTEWSLIKGIIPPLTTSDWIETFDKYKLSKLKIIDFNWRLMRKYFLALDQPKKPKHQN